MAPVVGESVMPVGHVPLVATVALPVTPKVAGAPFTTSLLAMLAIGVVTVPAAIVALSLTGAMLAVTTIVSTIVAQLTGELVSHN